MRRLIIAVFGLLLIPLVAPSASEAVGTWLPTPHATFAPSESKVNVVVPDGNGKLYVGGTFASVNGTTMNGIALYDPDTNTWSALGSGVQTYSDAVGTVRDILVAPNGLVYVAGVFFKAGGQQSKGVAAWNPAQQRWTNFSTALEPMMGVTDLVWSNSKLYAGGYLRLNDPQSIGVWDGNSWSIITGLVGRGGTSVATVEAMAADAQGNIYVAGNVVRAYNAGGPEVAVNGIAKWNGSQWSAVGDGLPTYDRPLEVKFHNGNLYASTKRVPNKSAGESGLGMAKIFIWDGGSWTSIPVAEGATINDFEWTSDDKLVVTGDLWSPQAGIRGLAEWNGSWNGTQMSDRWNPVGENVPGTGIDLFIDNSDVMFVGGKFDASNVVGANFARMYRTQGELTFSSTVFPSTAYHSSTNLTVTAAYSGGTAVTLENIALIKNAADGTSRAAIFNISNVTDCQAPIILPHDTSCEIRLSWDGSHPDGLSEYYLEVTSSVGVTQSITRLPLFAHTESGGPILVGGTDFGVVEVGTSSTHEVTLSNLGELSAPIDQIVFDNAHIRRTDGTCGANLAAGATCTLEYTWTPTSETELTESFAVIYRNGGETRGEGVWLTGAAVQPVVEAVTPGTDTLEPNTSAHSPVLPAATGVPGPVRKMRANKTGKITWSAPRSDGHLPITGYKVAVRKAATKKFHTVATVKKTTYTFKKLKPGKYVAQVTSMNSMGGLLPKTVKFTIKAKR